MKVPLMNMAVLACLPAHLVLVSTASAFAPVSTTTTAFSVSKTRNGLAYQPQDKNLLARFATNEGGNPFQSFIGSIFKENEVETAEPEKPKIPDFVVDPSYSVAIGFAVYGILFLVLLQGSIFGVVLGGLNVLFASFLAVQTYRLRFVFDETSFELKEVDSGGLVDSGENVVVGGQNRWTYDSFVNWDFFPSVDIPILVYFKETQTSQEKWSEGPGQLDKVGGGQIHFFPAIANCKQLENQFQIRGCATVDS